jgi:NADPH:quinone reductase-like Zn-dependent oxidoreductase
MHAVVITEPGEPDVLRWLEVPDPVPGPGEVVIEVAASGVNRADLMQREGRYAGRVAAVIDRKLPMSQAAQAHRAMAASEHIGKIVLVAE